MDTSFKSLVMHLKNRNKHFIIQFILLMCFFDFANTSFANTLKIVVPTRDVSTTADSLFFYPLLKLALSKTIATDGPFTTEYFPQTLSSARILSKMKNNDGINVVWTSTSAEREHDFLFVPVSLLKELSNYRVFLIRRQDEASFSKVQSLEELRKLNVGMGGQWPDAVLLRNNGFEPITSIYYESLFKMLAAKRFDYFPRGLFEAWNDLDEHKNLGLMIEPHLMFYYRAPFYFFVNKQNTALADRLERGLKIALADGSFDELMFSVPNFKKAYEEQLNPHRTTFKLKELY
jgi:hypothetical protein